MTYTFKNGKWIICKDGTYFALTKPQLTELLELLVVIGND